MIWSPGQMRQRLPTVDRKAPAVELVDATVTFNQGTVNEVTVLKDINLRIPSGTTVVVNGGNGSGKSTLLNAIAGTVPLSRGRLLIHGIDVTTWPMDRRARLLSFVHQDPLLGTSPNLSVFENLCLADDQPWWLPCPMQFRLSKHQRTMLANSGLPLDDKAALPVSLMSGGQRQFLALLIALSLKRPLVLLDEFTAALDNEVRQAALTLLCQRRSENVTMLAVLHQPDVARSINPTSTVVVANCGIEYSYLL